MSTTTACPYLVGVASVDVTPPVGSKLAGFAARTADSTGVYLPLRAVVTAITDRAADRTVVIVSVEWLGFYDNTDDVRALIEAATGVPPDHILLCGTHTHCGPPVRQHIDADCRTGIDAPFLQASFKKIAATARTALDRRQPARLRSSVGWCGFAHSRRRPDGKGGVTWNPTLDAPHDHSVPILRCEDETGRLLHLMFSYAAHPTSAGAILEIGGDYAGFAMRELETSLGCTSAFLLGCAGDQKPFNPSRGDDGFPAYPLPEVKAFGLQLAEAVSREVAHGRWFDVAGPMVAQTRKVELHTTVLARADYAAWLDSDNEFFTRWARDHVALLDRGDTPETRVAFELHTITFGSSLVLVGMTGEMSAEYGLRMVKELGRDFTQVWPIGYANEIVGYVPAERQLPEGGYEVFANMQYIGKPGPYASGTEDRIFAAVRAMLGVK